MQSLEDLQRKVGNINKVLAILENDSDRLTSKLQEFGINIEQANIHLSALEKKDAHIIKKIDSLHAKAGAILDGIEE